MAKSPKTKTRELMARWRQIEPKVRSLLRGQIDEPPALNRVDSIPERDQIQWYAEVLEGLEDLPQEAKEAKEISSIFVEVWTAYAEYLAALPSGNEDKMHAARMAMLRAYAENDLELPDHVEAAIPNRISGRRSTPQPKEIETPEDEVTLLSGKVVQRDSRAGKRELAARNRLSQVEQAERITLATAKRVASRSATRKKVKRTPKGQTPAWWGQAIRLLKDTPGLADAEIARRVGIARSTICEYPEWKKMRAIYAPPSHRATKFEKRGGVRKRLPNT